MRIQITFSGRAYHRSVSVPSSLSLAERASVQDALASLTALIGPLADSVLVAVSGQHVGTIGHPEHRILRDQDELFLFAPVAGG